MLINDIRVRDPFIYADAESGTYYLYVQAGNRKYSDLKTESENLVEYSCGIDY